MGSLICLSMVMNNLCDAYKTVLIGVSLPMLVSNSLLNMSKKNTDDAISNMINWSLPTESKLRGSHLIGISLPNFINSLMSKNQKNLYFDLNACNKFIVDKDDLKRIESSFLIISGKLDKMTLPKSSSFLNSKLKKSYLEIIDDCGHFHIHERSDKVRWLIDKYIES
jgi:pimeloyl-ACP methyl ester carboxylesterase